MVRIEVIGCDVDRKVPALTYTITVSDGRSVSKDLCRVHAEPIEELLEEDGQEPEPEPEPVRPAVPEFRAPVAKKAATKKTPAKKATPARRRPRVVSLEEIEAKKDG